MMGAGLPVPSARAVADGAAPSMPVDTMPLRRRHGLPCRFSARRAADRHDWSTILWIAAASTRRRHTPASTHAASAASKSFAICAWATIAKNYRHIAMPTLALAWCRAAARHLPPSRLLDMPGRDFDNDVCTPLQPELSYFSLPATRPTGELQSRLYMSRRRPPKLPRRIDERYKVAMP